jgi:hypothetical protein
MISQIGKYLYSSLFFGFVLIFGTFSILNADWQQPPKEFLSNSSQASAGATDVNGNAIAIWSDDNLVTIQASYYSNGTWGPSQLVSNIRSEPYSLEVAMDSTGTGLALWREETTGLIKSALFSGGDWAIPIILDINPGPSTQLSVSMDGSGNGAGIWINNAFSEVRSSFYDAGTNSWSPFIPLGTGNDGASISYSANGTAIATWLNGGAVTASYYNGVIWLTPVALGFSIDGVLSQIDASGNAIAAWVDNATGDVFSSEIVGAVVTGPVQIAPGPGNVGLSLAVAPGGTAILIWEDVSLNGQFSTFSTPNWSAPLQFATDIPFPSGGNIRASVSVDSSGNALIVYGTTTPQILSVQLPLGGVLGPTLLVTNNVNSQGSQLFSIISALSSNGVGFAFWTPEIEGANFYGSVLISAPLPPSGITATKCKNKFAAQTDLVNIIRWTPSQDLATSSYNLRRNGVLIAVIPFTGPFVFYDHNRCKNVNYIYNLTALNIAGNESDAISVNVRW